MSFEKLQYADSKENCSPIIFDFKDDNAKVGLIFNYFLIINTLLYYGKFVLG